MAVRSQPVPELWRHAQAVRRAAYVGASFPTRSSPDRLSGTEDSKFPDSRTESSALPAPCWTPPPHAQPGGLHPAPTGRAAARTALPRRPVRPLVPSRFLIPTALGPPVPPSRQPPLWPTLTQQLLLSVCSGSSPHPRSWSSTDSCRVLFPNVLEGSRGRLVGQCYKVCRGTVTSQALMATHPHSLTHPEQLPALQAPLVVRALNR